MASRVTMLNTAKVKARLARIPKEITAAVGPALDREVDDLVEAQKRAAPVDETSDDPGALRDANRAYRNPDRPLSHRIINDAKDPKGGPIASHVEHGHRAVDGSHVQATPFFFPTYRARRRRMRRRILAPARKLIRQLFPR